MTNAPLSCRILIPHLHFSQTVLGILELKWICKCCRLGVGALHYGFCFGGFMRTKYANTNNQMHELDVLEMKPLNKELVV